MAIDPSWIAAGTQVLKSVTAQSAQPGFATSGNAPTVIKNDADFSGFTVATSGARADGAKISKTTSDNAGGMMSGLLSNVSPVALIAGAAVVVAVVWKRKKSAA